ncbi:DUF6460 domain-containing protein [Methylocapsa palsarum]|uniref:DUF6460 domain-containing protein n=1 Tax=Methylocapsa palsarum TaxID=1612308 RepID=A0A1I4BII1_9HYPH|nr:DUF6460 domain-containing protein [Methylocapsa palsarum]SFK68634.1 hypothetical protein SAMN05444581_11529 [Methylocapsa palsarum]
MSDDQGFDRDSDKSFTHGVDPTPHVEKPSLRSAEPSSRSETERARPAQSAPLLLPGDDALTRFLGGSPGAVFWRLLFASLIVGAFLMWLDIRPADIFNGLMQLVNRIWGLGFDAIREVADYILVGAALVIPVWLALRLLSMRGR